jgi:hypothetical protein
MTMENDLSAYGGAVAVEAAPTEKYLGRALRPRNVSGPSHRPTQCGGCTVTMRP